ncbi:MAG: hypothetical protein ACYCXB_08985 [Candidatus Humimicrobiaceae bacterium]
MKDNIKKVTRLKLACYAVLVFLCAIFLLGSLSSCSKPLVIPGVSIGYFIWKDSGNKIHIAWSGDRKDKTFSGIIKTDGDFTILEKAGIETEDKINQSPKEISFNATLSPVDYSDEIVISDLNYSYIDFNLKIDGAYDLARIHIGKYLNNPLSEEFRIDVNYFKNLKKIPWYNNHPFAEFFYKLYANKYLTFVYIYILGMIIIELLRITKFALVKRKGLFIGASYLVLFLIDAGFFIMLWYANGH